MNVHVLSIMSDQLQVSLFLIIDQQVPLQLVCPSQLQSDRQVVHILQLCFLNKQGVLPAEQRVLFFSFSEDLQQCNK